MTNQVNVRKGMVVCVEENCVAQIPTVLAEKNEGKCPKCAGVSQSKKAAAKKSNQKQTTKGEVKSMKAVQFKGFVKYQGIAGAEEMNSKIRFAVVNGSEVTNELVFGHSKFGGKATYLAVDGKPQGKLTVGDFLASLQRRGMNTKEAESRIKALQAVDRKSFVVGKCIKCSGDVTADAFDYVNRNHEEMGLGEFDMVCFKCNQPLKPKKDKAAKQQPKKQEAKGETVHPASARDAAPAEQKRRGINREKVKARREATHTQYEVPKALIQHIADFAVVTDGSQSVEVVKLLRSLKRLFGCSHEGFRNSCSHDQQLKYIEAERSEAVEQQQQEQQPAEQREAATQHNASAKEHNVEDKHNATKEHNAEIAKDEHNVIVCSKCGKEGHKDGRSPLCPSRKKSKSQEDVVNTPEKEVAAERSEAVTPQVEEAPTADAQTEMDTQEDSIVSDELPESMMSEDEHNGTSSLEAHLDNVLADIKSGKYKPVPSIQEELGLSAQAGQSLEVEAGSTGSSDAEAVEQFPCLRCGEDTPVSELDEKNGKCLLCQL